MIGLTKVFRRSFGKNLCPIQKGTLCRQEVRGSGLVRARRSESSEEGEGKNGGVGLRRSPASKPSS